MFWIYLALIAYFLDAIVFALDKYLLARAIPHPLPYAFYASILSVFAILLLPFGVHMPPSLFYFAMASASGVLFFFALIYFYKAIKAIDILEATPAVGAIAALATLFGGVYFLHEHLATHELVAFVLLVAGTFLMSYFHLKSGVMIHMLLAGIFFGLSSLALKYVFNLSSYVDGLFWSRWGLVAAAASLLIFPFSRRQILISFNVAPPSSKFLFIINKVLAAAGFLVLYYAIKLGSVVFVNALQGLQYVFILLIAAFASKKLPMLFERHVHEKLARKIVATALIVAGFFLLVI